MSDQFNDKHLLWWVLKAAGLFEVGSIELLDPTMLAEIGAPDWVLPALREKYEEMASAK